MPPADAGPLRALLRERLVAAFVEHGFKMVVALAAVRALPALTRRRTAGGEVEAAALNETTFAFLVFLVPHGLVSLAGGVIADRLGPRRVLGIGRAIEIAVIALAAAAFFALGDARVVVLVALGLLGARSGLQSPARQALLPTLAGRAALSDANGRLAAFMFWGVLLGTAIGSVLIARVGAAWMLACLLAVALLGLRELRLVPGRDAAPHGRSSLGAALRLLAAERPLRLAIAGLALFWFTASLLGHNVMTYTRIALDLASTGRGVPIAALALGTIVGARAAGRVSRDEIEVGLAPLGAIAAAALMALHAWWQPGFFWTCALLFVTGAASAFLLVPLSAMIQWRAPENCRGAVLGITSFTCALAVLGGSFATLLLARAGLGARGVLAVTAAVAVVGTAWAVWMLPSALVRALVVVLTRTMYRVRVVGRENVPRSGGVLLTPNHVSFLDGLLVIASIDRPVRFLVHSDWYKTPLLRPFMRAVGGIPVAAGSSRESIDAALGRAGEALDRGEVVCVFPEGQITRTGTMHPFRRGMERIAAGRHAQIVPVYLDRLWGSVFSRSGGRFLAKMPERLPRPLTVLFGAPLPAGTEAADVRSAVERLGATAWRHRGHDAVPLHTAFLRTARRAPFRFAVAEGGERVGRLRLLARSVALARALREECADERRVGCALRPGIPGAEVQVAAALAGLTLVRRRPGEAAPWPEGVRHVIVSGGDNGAAHGAEPLDVAALRDGISAWQSALAWTLAVLCPPGVVERRCRGGGDSEERAPDGAADVVTVLRTRGTAGPARDVALSHYNVHANVSGVAQVLRAEPGERLMCTAPAHTAVGSTTLWLSLVEGIGAVLVPDPRDAEAVGRAAQRGHVTILVCRQGDAALYAGAARATRFGTLRQAVVTGARLDDELRAAFEDRFGCRPVEAYTVTECGPFVALGAADFRAHGFFQAGTRRGFVGQPLPGAALRTVRPGTLDDVDRNEAGELLVQGQSVSVGYADDGDPLPLRGGWYATGDLGAISDDGFVRVVGRVRAAPDDA